MTFTEEDVNAVAAVWQEWAGHPFLLDLRIGSDPPVATILAPQPALRMIAHTYVQVEIRRLDEYGPEGMLIFCGRCPADGRALRTMVGVLARELADSELG